MSIRDLWVKANEDLHHDKSFHDADLFELSLMRYHKFTPKMAKAASGSFVAKLNEFPTTSTKDDVFDAIVIDMKKTYKGKALTMRQKIGEAVKYCPAENIIVNPRRMTEDPLRQIPTLERPNLKERQLQGECVGYILGSQHSALKEMQSRSHGATCFFKQVGHSNGTIYMWGDAEAVQRLDSEIEASVSAYYQNHGKSSSMYSTRKGKGGKDGDDYRAAFGKGKGGKHSGQFYAAWPASHGAWPAEGKGRIYYNGPY